MRPPVTHCGDNVAITQIKEAWRGARGWSEEQEQSRDPAAWMSYEVRQQRRCCWPDTLSLLITGKCSLKLWAEEELAALTEVEEGFRDEDSLVGFMQKLNKIHCYLILINARRRFQLSLRSQPSLLKLTKLRRRKSGGLKKIEELSMDGDVMSEHVKHRGREQIGRPSGLMHQTQLSIIPGFHYHGNRSVKGHLGASRTPAAFLQKSHPQRGHDLSWEGWTCPACIRTHHW